jgi:hypothetical protein
MLFVFFSWRGPGLWRALGTADRGNYHVFVLKEAASLVLDWPHVLAACCLFWRIPFLLRYIKRYSVM